jgi:hypothetical protein
MDNVFKEYPDLIAVIGIKNGAAFLDTCDEKVAITELMVLLNKFTQEYLEAIAQQSNPEGK